MKIDENNLQLNSLCGLIQLKDPVDPTFAPAVSTLRWSLLERFRGSIPRPEDIRSRFIFHWHESWGEKPRNGNEYWMGPKASVPVGSRLYKFLLDYECVRPMEPYELKVRQLDPTFAPDYITGMTCIVRKSSDRTSKQKAYILDFTNTDVAKRIVLPSYTALARWLYVREDFDESQLGILHLPLLYGTSWKDEFIKESLARWWINGIIQQETNINVYPIPGTHCRKCTMPCKGLYG